jgi:hypothetical protein
VGLFSFFLFFGVRSQLSMRFPELFFFDGLGSAAANSHGFELKLKTMRVCNKGVNFAGIWAHPQRSLSGPVT